LKKDVAMTKKIRVWIEFEKGKLYSPCGTLFAYTTKRQAYKECDFEDIRPATLLWEED